MLAAGLALRVAFLSSTLLRLEGDEAVTGIMAQRILEGHHLAFFPGQGYMGSGEQYLQALVLWVLPDTPFTLRLVQLALGVVAGAGVYLLARQCLGSHLHALLATALFAAGPFYGVFWSVKSRLELSGMLAGLAGLLLALSIRADDDRLRAKLFGLGLAVGVGFWANWQSAYLLLPAAWWVLGTLGRRAVRHVPVTLAGFLLGAAPSLLHALLSGSIEASGRHPPSSLVERGKGLFRVTLPLFVGANDGAGPLPAWLTPARLTAAILGLLAVALFRHRHGLVDLVRLRSGRRQPLDLLLLAVLVAPALYVSSGAAASPSPAYLFPHYAVFPVLLAALLPAPTTPARRRVAPAMAAGMILLLLAQTATVARKQLKDGGGGGAFPTGERILTERLPPVIDFLVAAGTRSVFADYWLANPMQFLAGDRLVVTASAPYRFVSIAKEANCDPSPALIVPTGAAADALRAAITAAGSTARETHLEGLALFTGIEPGLRPLESIALDAALVPAVPGPACPRP